MRELLLVFLLGLLPVFSFGQNESKDSVYTTVDQMPEYPGGTSALISTISKNLRVNKEDVDEGFTGKLVASFTINKNGKVEDIRLIKGNGFQTAQNLLLLIKNMPEWKPGKLRGKVVNVKYVLPVTICFLGD
jgi:protein TonB